MNAADRVRPVKIGDGARHLQSAVVCAGRQSEGLGGLGEKRSARRVWRRETLKGLQIEDGVEASAARRLRFAIMRAALSASSTPRLMAMDLSFSGSIPAPSSSMQSKI